MITVWINGSSLRVQGHAGYAAQGSDIVCAAASMLAFTLAEAVRAQLCALPVVECEQGAFALEVHVRQDEQQTLRVMLETIHAGYRLLAERYPEHVRVMSGEHSENISSRPGERPPDGQKEEGI